METTDCSQYKSKSKMKKTVFGLVVILAGLVFLGFNTGHIPMEYKRVFVSWQMLIIAIGFINLFDRKSFVFGAVMVTAGAFFLAPRLDFMPVNFVHMFWPALLIFAGVMIIFKNFFCKKNSSSCRTRRKHQRQEFKNDGGYIEETNVFSGSNHIITNPVFKGGKITNVFGGSKIDLSNTVIEGTENVLEIDCVFGGVEIKAPYGWNIKNDITAIMGGYKDKHNHDNGDHNNETLLIIKGSVIFGGVDIKRY